MRGPTKPSSKRSTEGFPRRLSRAHFNQFPFSTSTTGRNITRFRYNMKIAIVSARYMEQHAIEAFFGEVFGYGQARVTVSQSLTCLKVKLLIATQWARGRFQCALPRALSHVR
jgi:hypothetical protein